MQAKAAVIFNHQETFKIHNIDVNAPAPDEVLIKIVATGVCHTDMVAKDLVGLVTMPAILGHEGAGIIEAVGSNVQAVNVGDHVVLSFASCGECENCATGHPAVCYDFNQLNFSGCLSDHTTPYHFDEQALLVFFGQSSLTVLSPLKRAMWWLWITVLISPYLALWGAVSKRGLAPFSINWILK